MSLVSDALKKARQEAARQDAAQRGLPYAVGAAEKPRSSSLLVGVIAGSVTGVVLLGVIAYLAGWLGPGRSEKPVVEAAVTQESPEPAAVPETSVPEPSPTPTTSPVVVAEATPPPPPPSSPAPSASPPVVTTPPPAEPTLTVEPTPVVAPETTPGPTAAEPKRYVGSVPLPGGAVTLNGIAYSEQNPIAVLDGRVVGPGESVQGFTVVAIERKQVKLEGHGQVVYLALR